MMLVALPLAGSSQTHRIRGIVTDADTKQAIPYAHVFISNTTLGSITNEQGRFDFHHSHQGPGQLIVSFVGYEQFSATLSPPHKDIDLQIRLKPSQAALEDVTVAATEDKEWQRNLKFFKKEFLGRTSNAGACEIINPWVLEFNRKGGLFQADASAPLHIVNRSLGYEMIFYLNQFETSADRYSIVGPVRFGDMAGADDNQAWQAKRAAAFQGSVKQFFKLLWKDQHTSNGFKIYKSVNALEEEQRTLFFERDLGVRVKEVKREDLVRDDSREGLIFFSPKPVEVHYEPGRDFEPVYRDILHQVSWIQASGGTIRFDSTGNILNPQDVIVSGYWNRLRVGDLLPLDYSPDRKPVEHAPEKLVIITDKGVYTKASQLWYTVLVSGMSPAVQVQLVDSTNSIIETRLDPVENGTAAGTFKLPAVDGTFYLQASSSASFSEGKYYIKPLLVTSSIKMLACSSREELARISWKTDTVQGKEMLALSLIDGDQDTLRGTFGVSIVKPGSECDCLDGKAIDFPRPKGNAKLATAVHDGIVTNKKGQPLQGRLVFLTSNFSSSFERDLGADGKFRLDDIITFDSTTWLAQLYDEKNKAVDDFQITWDQEEKTRLPRIRPWQPPCVWIDRKEPLEVVDVRPLVKQAAVRNELKLSDSVTLLSEVTVRARRIKSDKKPETTFRSYGNPQYVVTGEELKNAPAGTNIINTLASRVPGIVLSEGNNNWGGKKTKIKIRGSSSFLMQEDPLIILDGMPMDNFDLAYDILQTIPLTDVDRIEVRTSLSPMQGLKGNNGVIAVYTKRSSNNILPSTEPSAFVRKVKISGYSSPPHFARDSTSNSTLLWQPEVEFGTRPVFLYTSELPEVFDITVAGFNQNGDMVFIRKRIDLGAARSQLGSTSN